MMVRRGRPWATAAFVLIAALSASGSAELSEPPAATKLSPRLTRPATARSADRLLGDGDELTPRPAPPDRVADSYRSARLILRDGFVPSKSYLKQSQNDERLAPRSSPGPGATRHKRYVAFPDTRLPDASDSATIDRPAKANGASQNATLTRVPLYKSRRHVDFLGTLRAMKATHRKDPISSLRTDDSTNVRPISRGLSAPCVPPSSRARRSPTAGDDYLSRNASDYYAERRAVMARFYARQREIKARYDNHTNSSSSPGDPATSNVTLFRLYPNRNFTFTDNAATFRHPSKTIDPLYSNAVAKLDGRPVVQEADHHLGSRTPNAKDQVALRYTTPVPCANASLSGTFAPKKRPKTNDLTDVVITDTQLSNESRSGSDHEIWGECRGKIVYQHNLLLGLKGPSTLDTMFEVILQGPVCITCSEVLRYNETRAKVKFVSGGPGHDYVKVKLQGYENEGFSYIIKVWGVRKVGPDCSNV